MTEPVGTIPTHRSQGLSRALNLEALRRMRDRGMHTAIMQTASFQTASFNLPAQATYLSCGHTRVDEDVHYILERDDDTT